MAFPRGGDDAGFSLVEMLAALAVVMVMGTAVAGGLTTATKASASSRSRVVASSLASQELELARSTPQASLVAPSTTTSTPAVDGRTYTVTRTVTWRSAPGVVNRCSGAGTGRYAYKQVSVTVTWPGSVSPVVTDTLITPPGGDVQPDTGSQRVRVLDRNGGLRTGVTVTVTGPTNPAAQVTDGYGCAFFPSLTPGTYTISLSSTGGAYPFVDTQGLTVTSKTVSISGAETPPLVELQYDVSGAIVATAVSTDTSASVFPVATPAGATVYHSALSPAGTRSSTGASPTTISSLFPFRTGQYNVWAGTCADADPAFHSPFTRPAPVAVNPGAPTAVNVPMKPLYARIKTGNGANSTGDLQNIYVVHAATSGCGPVVNPGINGGSVGMAIMVKTDSNGYLRIALPYGTYRLEPRPGEGTYRANSFTLTPTSSDNPSATQVNIY